MTRDIIGWQRRFYAGPFVWSTWYREEDGIEELGNVYDSEEAAAHEVEWAKRHSKRNVPIVRQLHIHSLQLSKERWSQCS